MPRMELTIKTDYLPEWGATEGIRELVSNGRDAEHEFDAPMTIDWYNNTLRIENNGCTLPREALLFGHTTKTGNSEMVGKFGEGLKLGVLALVRNGFPIKIRSGSEVWIPVIEHSDKFNAHVLVFNIAEGRKPENRVRVEIGNISKETWLEIRKRFLFLIEKDVKLDKVSVFHGCLLLAPEYAGKIFIKGVFVQDAPDYAYGYDLAYADLDRDRKMVESYSLKSRVADIWGKAVKARPSLLNNYFDLFLEGKADISGVSKFSVFDIPEEVRKNVAAKFTQEYGEDAFPVVSEEQARELGHWSKRGIVVNDRFVVLLTSVFGDIDALKNKLSQETKAIFPWEVLTEDEKMNMLYAADLLKSVAADFKPELLDIIEFGSDILLGLYDPNTGRLQVARKELMDRNRFLATLTHEFAHHRSKATDGEKSHILTIENLWTAMMRKVWKD
jgi:hypothetical protein